MNKTVGSVLDDINEWNGPNGTIYYVTAFFTDESVGSVGRKDYDAALEVQGLLREAIDTEQDFTLEDKGKTKTGKQKFNIKGFGTPGGAATYTAPGVQGGGGSGGSGTAPHHRSPEQIDDIRRAVALKAAAQCVVGTSPQDVLKFADIFLEWLSSEPALGAYEPVEGSPSPPQAGAGSEDTSEVGAEPSAGRVSADPRPTSEDRGEEASEGEAGASSPHQHDWQMRQGIRSHLVCDCGATRKKETV